MKLKQGFGAVLCALELFAACAARAQGNATPPPSAAPKYSAADLEKLAAPIALHPDPLVAIILPASVYPLEIVQVARFVQDTNNLAKLDAQPWDVNVKALAKFPSVLQKMNDDLPWTMDLGRAFLDQQKELMDTIQSLRAKANAAGVLKTTPQQVVIVTNTVVQNTVEQQVVVVTNTVVQIVPSNPQVIYVPTYPPTIYYPAPVYVGPPPVVTFAAGIAVGAIIANNCDWHGGGIYVGSHGVAVWGGGSYHSDVDIDINRNVNVNTGDRVYGGKPSTTSGGQQKWQPDQSRMGTAGAAGTKSGTQAAQARGWSSGAPQAAPSSRAPTATARPAPGAGAASTRPAPPTSRPTPSSPAPSRPSPGSPSAGRPSTSSSRESAFGGVNSGANARQSSSRGSYSRGGGGRSFGGRGR